MCMANGPYRSRCNFVGTPRVVEGCTTDRLEAHRFIFGAHVRASVLLVASSSPSHYSCTTPAEGERTSQQHEAPKKPTRPSRRSSQRPIKASGQCRARRPTRFVAWQGSTTHTPSPSNDRHSQTGLAQSWPGGVAEQALLAVSPALAVFDSWLRLSFGTLWLSAALVIILVRLG